MIFTTMPIPIITRKNIVNVSIVIFNIFTYLIFLLSNDMLNTLYVEDNPKCHAQLSALYEPIHRCELSEYQASQTQITYVNQSLGEHLTLLLLHKFLIGVRCTLLPLSQHIYLGQSNVYDACFFFSISSRIC